MSKVFKQLNSKATTQGAPLFVKAGDYSPQPSQATSPNMVGLQRQQPMATQSPNMAGLQSIPTQAEIAPTAQNSAGLVPQAGGGLLANLFGQEPLSSLLQSREEYERRNNMYGY